VITASLEHRAIAKRRRRCAFISDEGDRQENRIAASSAKSKENKAGWSFYQGQMMDADETHSFCVHLDAALSVLDDMG
jgi:hypothetical protein